MIRSRSSGHGPAATALVALAALAMLAVAARGQELSARATVDQGEVYVGDGLVLHIEVGGSDSPDKPDVSALADFSVEDLGGQRNSSVQTTIINGKMTRTENRGYVFVYRLTPRKAGTLVIPSLEISAGGKRAKTAPVTIEARMPEETADFKLRQALSASRCYVGEPVFLEVTWYVSREVRGPNFVVPVLEADAFAAADPADDRTAGRQYHQLNATGGDVVAVEGQGTLDGRGYTTVTFRKVLIPRRAGSQAVPAATVVFEALAGIRQPRNPFDGFFPSKVYRKFVVPSNALSLEVLPLPEAGRPPNFAGHVGEYNVETVASPTEVNVGDPITLNIILSGPKYLQDVKPPDLQQSALARDFKIPVEMAPGRIEGEEKVFTQSIRAKHADVKEIPAIELPYFDTKAGKYRTASSKSVPLQVKQTRVVGVEDGQGGDNTGPAGSALEQWAKGIMHNYEDLDALVDQKVDPVEWLCSPSWLGLLILPPAAYAAILLALVVVRRRRADPLAAMARRAYGQLMADLRRAAAGGDGAKPEEAVLAAMRAYLGSRLRLSAAALTSRDAEPAMRQLGASDATVAALIELFARCEAGSYAGMAGATAAELVGTAGSVARQIERELR